MIAFVTGGTGFIGSHLVDNLLTDDSVGEVRCVVRNKEKWLTGKNYTRVECDLFHVTALRKAMEGADTLYHIAGAVKAPSRRELFRVNVEATETIIRLAHKVGVNKMIVLSSLAAAGPSSGEPLTEEAPCNPVSQYGESKLKMEQMIHNLELPGLSVALLRPPAVYGPREDQIYSWFKMLNMRIGPIVGDGKKPHLSLVYVSDLVDGIRLSERDTSPGIDTYFLSGPDICNWNQIKKVSSNVLGKRSLPLYIRPNWVHRIAGAVESTASLFGSYPDLNREKAKEMVLEWTCSSRKAELELGYSPSVSLEEGISRTIHWYKKHHWL